MEIETLYNPVNKYDLHYRESAPLHISLKRAPRVRKLTQVVDWKTSDNAERSQSQSFFLLASIMPFTRYCIDSPNHPDFFHLGSLKRSSRHDSGIDCLFDRNRPLRELKPRGQAKIERSRSNQALFQPAFMRDGSTK